MSAEIFIDTNVLVYAYDPSVPEKQRHAALVLDRLLQSGRGVLSTQVLSEFYNATTRKLDPPLTSVQAYARLEHYARFWPVLNVTSDVILKAAQGVQAYNLSFWDAQIWAVAQHHGVGIIFSEDFSPGAVIGGVRFENPFAPDFDFAAWGFMKPNT